MGLDTNGIRFLLHAKQNGVSFRKMVTIGRQSFYAPSSFLKKNLEHAGIYIPDTEINELLSKENGYAEPFYKKILGAIEIDCIDNSTYEGATVLHDMNTPIPDSLRNKYSVVLDGGSLEHIFNFPVAIKNCMDMVQIGGHFLAISPANNFCGHGFYQFSPELWFRLFSEENGFEVEKIILFKDSPDAKWFEIIDPKIIKKRMYLINNAPTYLLIQAKKIQQVPFFIKFPVQSDYTEAWDKGYHPDHSHIDTDKNNDDIFQSYLSLWKDRLKKFLFKILQKKKDIYEDIGHISKENFKEMQQ